MKVLVTGGAGFIGSHLVDRLLDLGHEVVVIDDFSLGKNKNIIQHKNNPRLITYTKSICGNLSKIFEKESFDLVFHLAAIPRVQYSIDHPIESHKTNIDGTLNLLSLSKQYGVRRFIFSSSSSVYGDQKEILLREDLTPNPMSPYALHKLTGEYYCKLFYNLYGLETVSLRYFNVFGSRQDPSGSYSGLIPKFTTYAIEGMEPTVNGDGKQKRDFVFVGDVVTANILAATTKNKKCLGEVFNIGSGSDITVNDMTKKIFTIAHSQIKPLHGTSLIEPRTSLASLAKTKKLLGWSPRVGLDDGLREVYNSLI